MRTRVALILGLILMMALGGPLLHAQPDPLRVIASSSILADVAGRVAGDAAEITSLMPLFADPHSYTPTPQDLVALAEADAIFMVGAGLEENLTVALEDIAVGTPLIAVSRCVNILPFGVGTFETEDAHEDHADDGPLSGIAAQCAAHHAELEGLLQYYAGTEQAHDADHTHEDEHHAESLGMLYTLDCGDHDDHGHDDHAGAGHDGAAGDTHDHAEGSCDPHVWTDPHNVMLWTLLIRDSLHELDPANGRTYAYNAAAYLEELHALVENDVEPLLASIPPENRRLVTNHLAFSYYARAFDLEMLGTVIPGASTLAEPSAAEIAALIGAIQESGVPAVFAETTANPTLAEQVAAETGAAFYTLYTGSLSEPDGPAGTYLDYTRHNTRVITEALGGTLD